MDVSIIVIGDELLIGQVTDTNSGWIARHINPIGWKVKSVRTVADDAADIKKAIEQAFAESDLILTTGGLGPTKDDITKETLRQIFGGEMIHDKATEANVLEVVEKRHLKINPLTAAQADVPSSCQVIQNKVGTAPIMWFEKDGKVLVSMPGVPFETEIMMETEVIPQLIKRFASDTNIEHHTFVVIDYSESVLAMALDEFEKQMPDFIHLAYLPKPGVIRLRLTGQHRDAKFLSDEMKRLSEMLKSIIGDKIIATEDKTVFEILGDKLRAHRYTLATAESCTGGNIAHEITEIAGSSDYYQGTIVSYSNDVKRHLLGVSGDDLKKYGAVSLQVVEQMCNGVASALNCNCAIATSGIAGPSGGTPDKPVGTVCMAVKCNDKIRVWSKHFPGNRARVIDRATTEVVIELIKML